LTRAGIEDAGADARLLLLHVGQMTQAQLFMKAMEPMPDAQEREYRVLLQQRAEHIPCQHLIGEQDFCGLSFEVNEQVLIPRPETELLAEAVFSRSSGKKVLDLCTGSGCIAVAVAVLGNPKLVAASDYSKEALLVAERNAKRSNASIAFFQGDLFENIDGRYDIIVSNPPYIPSSEIETLMPEVKDHEPRAALDGEADGLAFYRRIISEAPQYLEPNGKLMFEIGYDQGESVPALLLAAGFVEIEVKKDYSGLDRMVFATWAGTKGDTDV